MMKRQLPDFLFDKYLNGNCNPQEEAIVREWYNDFINDDDRVSLISNTERTDLKIRIRKAIDESIALQQKAGEEIKPTKKTGLLKYMVYS
ncbi:MAG: hypothetical protein EOO07_39400, partial [Chitinophagaceae bacterium]